MVAVYMILAAAILVMAIGSMVWLGELFGVKVEDRIKPELIKKDPEYQKIVASIIEEEGNKPGKQLSRDLIQDLAMARYIISLKK